MEIVLAISAGIAAGGLSSIVILGIIYKSNTGNSVILGILLSDIVITLMSVFVFVATDAYNV